MSGQSKERTERKVRRKKKRKRCRARVRDVIMSGTEDVEKHSEFEAQQHGKNNVLSQIAKDQPHIPE